MSTSTLPSGSSDDLLRGIAFVFFDFAGTLVEGVPNWEHPQVVACAEAGSPRTPAEIKAAIWRVWGPIEGCSHVEASADENSYATWIGAIERQILSELDLPIAALDRATARVTELQVAPASYRVYPEVIPTLAQLRARGIRLGLISNFAWRLPELVDSLGLPGYFNPIVTSARAGYRKPRPEIFRQALEEVGARPETTLYVGDDPVCDVEGARNAGLRAVWLNRKGTDEPERSIRTLRELVTS